MDSGARASANTSSARMAGGAIVAGIRAATAPAGAQEAGQASERCGTSAPPSHLTTAHPPIANIYCSKQSSDKYVEQDSGVGSTHPEPAVSVRPTVVVPPPT